MANYKILVTRDIKANVYSMPTFHLHIGHAIRSFADQCMSGEKGNVLADHPEDFELLQIGEYDDVDGCFISYDGIPADDTRNWGHKQLAAGSNYRK